MTKTEEKQRKILSEAQLSAQDNTVSGICRKYLENSCVRIVSVAQFQKDFAKDIQDATGHGISEVTAKKTLMQFSKCTSKYSIMVFLSSKMLAGDGLKTT